MNLDEYADILTKAKKKKNIHDMTLFLREHRYMFVNKEIIEGLKLDIQVLPKHQKYSFMVLCLKDLDYDVKLALGVKLVGHPTERVHVYINGRYWETFIMPIGKVKENFRKKKIYTIFPKAMNYDQRAAWRKEHQKTSKNPEKYPPTKFYLKWKDQVVFKDRD